ncbi:MAG: hypothetical protein V3V10_09130, partial [Planctomycetota bacterium]
MKWGPNKAQVDVGFERHGPGLKDFKVMQLQVTAGILMMKAATRRQHIAAGASPPALRTAIPSPERATARRCEILLPPFQGSKCVDEYVLAAC